MDMLNGVYPCLEKPAFLVWFMASVTALITQKERTVNAARKVLMTRPGGRLQLKTPLNAEDVIVTDMRKSVDLIPPCLLHLVMLAVESV